jgi:hypothetical protein
MAVSLYIKHRYNQTVVDNFLGYKYVGAERMQPLKERIVTSLKVVQKLSAQAQKAVGNDGGPFAKKIKRSKKRGR